MHFAIYTSSMDLWIRHQGHATDGRPDSRNRRYQQSYKINRCTIRQQTMLFCAPLLNLRRVSPTAVHAATRVPAVSSSHPHCITFVMFTRVFSLPVPCFYRILTIELLILFPLSARSSYFVELISIILVITLLFIFVRHILIHILSSAPFIPCPILL